MGFSEKIKLKVRNRAFFRCCICHKAFVEVHHIIPKSEGGEDTFENAAPLCASCHDLFGANPNKRKRIRQMRDYWYEQMDQKRLKIDTEHDWDDILPIKEKPENINILKEKKIALYHIVFKEEGFEESTRILFDLVKFSQKRFPNQDRILYLDIEGHRNNSGGYDNDMFELMRYFILEFLLQFLSEAYTPLIGVKNKRPQSNDVKKHLIIINSKEESLAFRKKYNIKDENIESYPKK